MAQATQCQRDNSLLRATRRWAALSSCMRPTQAEVRCATEVRPGVIQIQRRDSSAQLRAQQACVRRSVQLRCLPRMLLPRDHEDAPHWPLIIDRFESLLVLDEWTVAPAWRHKVHHALRLT